MPTNSTFTVYAHDINTSFTNITDLYFHTLYNSKNRFYQVYFDLLSNCIMSPNEILSINSTSLLVLNGF